MALERQSIEKKDFPIGRRGYDPDAVDAHLRAVAEEIDEFKHSSRRRSETLASSASEQVRAIVEAAETSAADIQREAEEEARDIRAEASSEAQSSREQATAQARDYVGRVSESTAVMLQRLDAMEGELGALIESLRTGSNRLGADLQLLEGNLAEVGEAVAPRQRFEAEPEPEDEFVLETEGTGMEELQAIEGPDAYTEPGDLETAELGPADEPLSGPAHTTEPGPEPEPAGVPREAASPADGSDDAEGARLIALNMALNGTPREETDRYLEENFRLNDRAGLVDDVYASVEA
ncbi:MAG: DivIVA domain-containing protein [Actinomycetota bacterium]|nr:DivIVA domain-containing protein [Actinomycetota bacterium]